MSSSESRTENRAPSEAIVAFLKTRLADGREWNTTSLISERTGLSKKVVGTRMAAMAKTDWHGLSISAWTECVWLVKEGVNHGQREVREAV